MASGQENVKADPTDRVLNFKVAIGSNFDEQIIDFCGENDCSAAKFLRDAAKHYLKANGREVVEPPTPAK